MHPRKGKYSHANMVPVKDGVRGKQLPEAALVCNFPEATATDPGLMNTTTSSRSFTSSAISCTGSSPAGSRGRARTPLNLESDFIEAPSQMLEEPMRSPQVLAGFAQHYKNRETIPADLVAKMVDRASAFGRGSRVSSQDALSAISYEIYTSDPAKLDFDAITNDRSGSIRSSSRFPGTHFWPHSCHLCGDRSAYYTYLWDKVIAEDFASQFDKSNYLADGPSMRYRKTVLEPGGTESANDLVQNFLGRAQNMDAFKKWMNEEFETTATAK